GFFGKRVGHGLLGLCLAEGLLNRECGEAISNAWEWQFVAPFFIGDTIHAEATVTAQEELGPLTVREESVDVFKSDGVLIQRGRRKRLSGRAEENWALAALRTVVKGFPFVDFQPDCELPPSTA